MGQIRTLQARIHSTATDKGWWEDLYREPTFLERLRFWRKPDPDQMMILWTAKLGLVTCEVAEAIEEIRDRRIDTWYADGTKKPEGVGIEMADAVIRLLDLAGAMGIDLEQCILEKFEFNLGRAYKHGNKVV